MTAERKQDAELTGTLAIRVQRFVSPPCQNLTKPNKTGHKIIANNVLTKRPLCAKLSLFKTNTRPSGTRKLEREENMKTTATVSENLLRLEYEVEGVTAKTLMFGVCYLPPSAVRRHTRNGIPLVQAIQTGSTPSFCKNEPLFKTRAEAQARCDACGAPGGRGAHGR